ncbi:MAG: hypothetical protein PVH19_13915 [Planctomycetia bacterium]
MIFWLDCRKYAETFQSDDLLVLDRTSGITEKFHRHELLKKYSFFNYNTFFFLSGDYNFLANTLVASYVAEDSLFIRIKNEEIKLQDSITINIEGTNEYRVLTIQRNEKIITQLQYSLPIAIPPTPADFPEYVDEEDYDYGLHLKNFFNNSTQKNFLLTKIKENEKIKKASGFYNVEKKLLEERGWIYNGQTKSYSPPGTN